MHCGKSHHSCCHCLDRFGFFVPRLSKEDSCYMEKKWDSHALLRRFFRHYLWHWHCSAKVSLTHSVLLRWDCCELTATWAGYRSPTAGDLSLHPTTAALNCLLTPARVVGLGISSHWNDEIRSLFAHPQASSRLQLWKLSAWSSYPTWGRNSACS